MASALQTGWRSRRKAVARLWPALALACGLLLCGASLCAQSLPPLPTPPRPSIAPSDAAPTAIHPPGLPPMPIVPGVEMDRVVAIVNGDVILDSDVDQERRLTALLPYGDTGGVYTRGQSIQRLINRDLILQQMKLQPEAEVSAAAADKDLEALRKTIPACKKYDCQTTAGWERFLASEGFTPASITSLWQQRMEVLAFIEQRFRMGVTISNAQIKDYYDNVMLKQYAAQHATPPPLASISSRIQQVLLQQQVSKLLDDWLNSLRAQGSVVVQHPGEETP